MPSLLRAFRAVFPAMPLACACLLASACKTDHKVVETRQELDPIRKKFAGNYQMVKDANGMVSVKSDRRSEFESKIYASSGKTKTEKDYKTGNYSTKDYQTKGFSGEKAYKTKDAKEDAKQSKWNWPWKNKTSTPKGADKAFDAGSAYDTGDEFSTAAAKDDGRSFATRDDPYTSKRLKYQDSALDNIRSPGAGEAGPTVHDIRGMLGKDN